MLNANSEIHRGSLPVLVGEPPRAASCGSDSWLPAAAAPSFTHRAVIGDGSGGLRGDMLIPSSLLLPALDVLPEPPVDPIQQRTGLVPLFKAQKITII